MNIPVALILFRFLLAPLILVLAFQFGEASKPYILVCMYLGLLSDVFDGIIARKQNIASAKLRRMDSQTDMVFWLSIGISTWKLYPVLIETHSTAIWAILAMEASVYVISFIRFGKETCTHAFLSKMWGLSLLIAFTSLIGFNHAGFPFAMAIILGLISHVDRILITLILKSWTHDVPSAYHAWLLRRGKRFKKNILLN
ncbi:MAG: CDP-alcohol phosphatidyltransferase family protein [Bacteroidetes bacterium]|nr:MAG: CDP-alcohol phosphatidyltransferase family protein [Bacteroidota bacterium]